jgi:hypothetical protein
MDINFYAINYKQALPIVSGKNEREWINNSDLKFYKDLSLTMAHESGWELRSPGEFTIEWNGGEKSTDLVVHSDIQDAHLFYTGMGHGICSIRAGYVIETPEDYAVLVTGAPNFFKGGISQMTSVIESNWAHMTFFLNWKMTNPGKVVFKKNEPLGFITVIPHRQLDNFELKIDTIMSNPDLFNKHKLWTDFPYDADPYVDGIENNMTLETTKKFHKLKREMKISQANKNGV